VSDDLYTTESPILFAVADTFTIRGRSGTVITGTLSRPALPRPGDVLASENHRLQVLGVERFVAFQGKPTRPGEPIGLLVGTTPKKIAGTLAFYLEQNHD
jgi:translation elongation factor EF-Tu-like GTPase